MPDLVDSIRPIVQSAVREAFAQIQPQLEASGRRVIASPEVTAQLQQVLDTAVDRELHAPATQVLLHEAAREAGREAARASWPFLAVVGGVGVLAGFMIGRYAGRASPRALVFDHRAGVWH